MIFLPFFPVNLVHSTISLASGKADPDKKKQASAQPGAYTC